jgi:hypothetical protein
MLVGEPIELSLVERVGKRPLRFLGGLGQPSPSKHFDYVLEGLAHWTSSRSRPGHSALMATASRIPAIESHRLLDHCGRGHPPRPRQGGNRGSFCDQGSHPGQRPGRLPGLAARLAATTIRSG